MVLILVTSICYTSLDSKKFDMKNECVLHRGKSYHVTDHYSPPLMEILKTPFTKISLVILQLWNLILSQKPISNDLSKVVQFLSYFSRQTRKMVEFVLQSFSSFHPR